MDSSPSVLIVRLDAIGDALALVPLLAALHARGARIDVILSPKNAGVFSKRAVDRVYIKGSFSAAALAQNGYDYALVATEDTLGYRLARDSGAPRRIGFQNGWGKPLKSLWARFLLTRMVYRTAGLDPRAPHECEVLYQLGRDIFGDSPIPRHAEVLRPFVVDTEPARDERIVFQITDKWQRLGAAPTAVTDLVHALLRRHPMRFLAAENERAFAQHLAADAGISVEYFRELGPWKDAIAAAKAVVAPDSGAVHVAGMTGTPVVAVFAQKHFALQTARWSPWAAPYKLVEIVEDWPRAAAAALDELVQSRAL